MATLPNISVKVDSPRIVVLYGADVLRRWDDTGDVWDTGVWDSQTGGLSPELSVKTDKINITVNVNP